jgi:uncharacterized protein DUF4928
MRDKNNSKPTNLDVSAVVAEWLESRRRSGKISRNTVAVGIVLLDKLRDNSPLPKEAVFSRGGEIKGARSGLPATLEKYGLPRKYLKEATTRQASHDGALLIEQLQYGESLPKDAQERDRVLLAAIDVLLDQARKWLTQQPIKVNCDRQQSPTMWVSSILDKAQGRSGGKVEQHLIGAKLKERHPKVNVPNYPGHAADLQTKRTGDFPIDKVSYHVTATDGKEAIPRCKDNIESGIHPVLLVPRKSLANAHVRAEVEGIAGRVSILGIEDFITQNVIELSTERQEDFFTTLQAIITEYNRRLEEVETDMSLKIELH